jgi:hypothetical protein
VSVTVAPDSEAHRHIDAVAPRYRTFALIAHLREAHGLTEVAPERAAIAHALFTRHEMALARPIASHRHPLRRPSPRRRRTTTRSPDADAMSRADQE